MTLIQFLQAGGTLCAAAFTIFTLAFAISCASRRPDAIAAGAAVVCAVLATAALVGAQHFAGQYRAVVAEHLERTYGATLSADAVADLPRTDSMGDTSVLLTVDGTRHLCVIDTRKGADQATALCTESDLARRF